MDRNNAGPKRIPPIRVSASDDSEEEIDREIIKSLTRAHPTNAEVNVDEMIALQQQESTNANLQPAPMAASTSLAKSPKRPKQDLLTDKDMADVVEMIALNEIQQQESTNENLQPAPMAASMSLAGSSTPAPMAASMSLAGSSTPAPMAASMSLAGSSTPAPIAASTSLAESPKQSKQDLLTDDDMADIEVSQLTSSFESRNRPGTSAVLKKPIASLPSSIPRRCQWNKENPIVKPPFNNEPFDLQIPIFPPLRELNFEFDSDTLMNSSTDRLSASTDRLSASTDRLSASTDRLSANGFKKRKNRESSGSRDSVPSVFSAGSSPDERQILVWRTDGNPHQKRRNSAK